MELHIRKNELISDIQKEFSACFPYLRIDFFRFPHIEKKMSPKDEKLDRFTPVDHLVKWDDDKVIEISENMTVRQFESIMDQRCGLFVQVFRKSGRVWIETSSTDEWTLKRQNDEGEMMSSIHEASSEKPVDWDDWDE